MVATFVVKPEAFMQPIIFLIAKMATLREGEFQLHYHASRLRFRPMVLYFEACLGDIVPASSEKYRGILPSASEWPHVLKLCLLPLQALAQALDVFIVLVLLLVHFQQRPQDFDATLFLHHTLSVFKLAYNKYGIGLFS